MVTGDRAGWPAWATEPVLIAEPDPRWRARAAVFAAEVVAVCGDRLVGEVEHIGSTAVPGLPAKPVIDLMGGVTALDVADDVVTAFEALRWQQVPSQLDVRRWRRLFVKVIGGRRVAHLHLMDPTHARWREHLAFRDRLRNDPDLRMAYATLKRRLASTHADDRERYTAGKAAFIRGVLDGA